PHLSLASGAIKGWDRRNQFYYQLLASLASHYDFDLDTPFEQLPANIREIILHGSGNEKIMFSYLNENSTRNYRKHTFEGIVPNLERRYRETESVTVREELAKYLNSQLCPDCTGTRLRREARHVRVAELAIYEISALPLKEAKAFFDTVTLTGHKLAIAEKII